MVGELTEMQDGCSSKGGWEMLGYLSNPLILYSLRLG